MTSTDPAKVVVAMSGGVDSTMSAWLLQRQGYDVTGVFIHNGVGPDGAPIAAADNPNSASARAMAEHLRINLQILDLSDHFDDLINYFADEYAQGRTPNPCVVCNRRIKFACLLHHADGIGARFIATGHYARIVRRDGQALLARAADAKKDQSYVLHRIGRDRLDRILFPVGDMTKVQVRQRARQLGLPVHDRRDSQEICFVPDDDYARLVQRHRPDAFRPGPILHVDGRLLGQHSGLANYTTGQRRGLGIALGSPAYVVRLDQPTNTVTLGPRQALLHRGLIARQLAWLLDPPREPVAVQAKIRYTHPLAQATLEVLPHDQATLLFDEPQAAITPGQAVVFYRDDIVLGGGWIDRWFDP